MIVLAALGACTPIAPSFYKATRGGNLGGVNPLAGEGSHNASAIRVVIFDFKIEDAETYDNAIREVARPFVAVQFSPETNATEFQQFNTQGSLAAPLGSILPEKVTAHLRLGISAFQIHQFGLNNVEVAFQQGETGQWFLSIQGPDATSALRHLEAIALVIKPSGSTLAP